VDEREPRDQVPAGGEDTDTAAGPAGAARPATGRRAVWAVVAAVAAAAGLWAAGEALNTEKIFQLAPVVSAGLASVVLAGVIRDPIGQLLLYALSAAGTFVTAVLLDAPIFGALIAAVIVLPPLLRTTGLGRVTRRALTPVRSTVYRGLIQPTRTWVEPRRRVALPLAGLLILTVFVVLPFLGDWFEIPTWLAAATSGGTLSRLALFILFALGLNVVVGFAGLLDLGYVAFWAIGSYTAAILTGAAAYTKGLRAETVTLEDKPIWEPWMWLILVAALGVAVVAGVILGSPTLRLRGDYLAIVTLGFGEIIRINAANLDDLTVGPRGIASIPHPEIHLFGLDFEWGTLIDVKYYWLLLAFVVLWIVAIYLLDNSRIGRAWVAIREDEVAAASMGVPVVRMKLAAFAIGACTAGVGGAIYAEQVNFINPDAFRIIDSIFILCAVVIGGLGSIPGSILGAAAIIVLPEVFREFQEYRFFAFGIALVIVMVFRPQGLLPSKRRKAELKGGVVDEQLYEAAHAAGS
jgi:branched-chain amino acid transport system permease protein